MRFSTGLALLVAVGVVATSDPALAQESASHRHMGHVSDGFRSTFRMGSELRRARGCFRLPPLRRRSLPHTPAWLCGTPTTWARFSGTSGMS